MYAEVVSNLRDIARRIGVARNPLEVRAEIESLANKLEIWDSSPLACHLPGEDGSDRWKPGVTDEMKGEPE